MSPDTNIGLYLLVSVIFLVAGLASIKQAFVNAKTSRDLDTGTWFFFGLILVFAGSMGIVFIFMKF